MVKIQIENAQAVQNAVNAFTRKVSTKIVRKGVRAAWTPLLKRAKANARALDRGRTKQKKSKRMGHLIAVALVLQPFKRQRPNQYGMKVWLNPKKAGQFIVDSPRTGNRNFIPAAIEYGHAFPGRGAGPGGGAPKDVAAKPFMRPALDVTLPAAPKIFERHLVHAIHEENAKR